MSVELETTGRAIWAAFNGDKLDAGSQALIRELARCADTLDRLDALAAGRRDGWAKLVFDEMGEIHLVVDKILDVRRNHQLAFKALYAEIRTAGIKEGGLAAKLKDEEPEDMLSKLRREKAARERQSG
jgi:hypothetical protein